MFGWSENLKWSDLSQPQHVCLNPSVSQLSSGNLIDVLQVLVLSWRFILHLELLSPVSQ